MRELSFHSWLWIGWLSAALATFSIVRNPMYLVLAWLCILILAESLRNQSGAPNLPISPLRFALLTLVTASLFNALFSHVGETVLFTIPGSLPLLSGPVTLESVVYGAINGLALAGILAAFSVINAALPARAVIRLAPRAFYSTAVVISIALNFIPSTMRQFEQIREAQAIRGHQLRKLGDWLPLLMPLLVGGLERAMLLAEATTARGFASAFEQPRSQLAGFSMLVGLLLLIGGWLLSLRQGWQVLALSLAASGAVFIAWALWRLSRKSTHSTYFQQNWNCLDSLALIGPAIVLVVLFAPLPTAMRETLFYSPYPSLSLPTFDPWLGSAFLCFLSPLLVKFSRKP